MQAARVQIEVASHVSDQHANADQKESGVSLPELTVLGGQDENCDYVEEWEHAGNGVHLIFATLKSRNEISNVVLKR